MQVIYRYEFTQLHYAPTNDLLYLKWQNSITSEDYLIVMRKVLALTKELDIKFWLFDGRETEAISVGDINWSIGYVTSFLKQTNLVKFARVETQNSEFENYWKTLILPGYTDNSPKLEVQYFKDFQDAVVWLNLDFPVFNSVNFTSHALYE